MQYFCSKVHDWERYKNVHKKSGNKHHLGCIPKQPTSTADSAGPSALHVGVGSVPMRVEDAETKRGNLHLKRGVKMMIMEDIQVNRESRHLWFEKNILSKNI